MRLSFVALGAIFLLLLGLRPQSLPFIPGSLFSDTAVSHWPAALHLREAVLARGQFPYWQPTVMGGQPFAANPLNKTAYPLQWLALLLPPALHLNVLIVLHVLLAAWGMWRWTRGFGLPDSAALLSALAYAFAPKTMAHIGAGHVDLLYALAWWPWLMLSVGHLVQQSNYRVIAQTGLFAALVFLADVRLSLFALTLAGSYGLWEITRRRKWRKLASGFAAGAIFGLLTLSVTVPLMLWQPYLSRSTMTAADAGVFALEAGLFVGLLLPPHSGNPETMTYLGLPVLVLAGIAVVSAPRKHPFWLIAAGLATFYALGQSSPFWSLLVDALPFLRWFRVPSRAWFVVVMVACLLAGYGLQVLSGTVARLRQNGEVRGLAIMRLALAGIMGASLLCGAMTLAFLPSLPQTIGLGVMGVGLLLGTTLLLAFYNQISPQRLAAMLALVLFIDLAWTGRNWLEWRGPEQWLTHQQTLVDAVQAENPARIYSPNYALEQQVAAANELRLFYGVDPFQLAGIVDAIEQGSGVPVMEYTVVLPPLNLEPVASDDRSPDERLRTANRDAAPDTAVLAEWGVSHVIATYPIEHERLLLAREVDGTFIYANLDFDPQTIFSESGWPLSGWPDLPDVATVADLNRMTAVSALIAGISFVLCVVFVFRGLLHR